MAVLDRAALLDVLTALVETAGVSGSETAVADAVAAQLTAHGVDPARLERDYLGSRWLRCGPDGDPQRLLVAHLDEIGLRITAIRDDGICRVQAVGGIDPQLWEGTAVEVHAAGGAVPGCIAPVSLHVTGRSSLGPSGRLKIEELLLDLGVASRAAVEALDIALLDPLTWPKRLVRLADGATVQGRSLDDRFGCAALVALAAAFEADPPPVPTVLAWAVQEEVGLRGARALAVRFPACAEVIAVDSYTVGTGPRDNRQFDSVALGGGPALRAWDATTLMPDAARSAVLDLAQRLGIPLQHGYMQGGNDASVFEAGGAMVLGLGVPLEYSHSAVERINSFDLERLVQLLIGLAATDRISVI